MKTAVEQSGHQVTNDEILSYFRPMPIAEEVLEVLAPRKKQHMLDWMSMYYVLPEKSSRIKGPWKLSITPYWRCVINWLCDLTTRVIWVYAATQTGKSVILGGWMGYVIDIDPGPMKVVLPDEKVVKKRIKRLKPAFENSPRILRHLGGDIRNLLIGEPTDLDNMQLVLAWPTSPITLSDDPSRYVAGDEVALWPQEVRDDTDAISLLGNRTRTYEPISKQFYVTSPKNKGDLADINFESCQKWSIHIQCPDCGKFHEAMFENVLLAKDEKGELIKPSEYKKGKGRKRNAWYQCPHCKSKWSELERKAAVSGCRACPEGCSINTNGEIEGDYEDSTHKALRVPSVLVDPMFTTVDTLAADFANAMRHRKSGNILPLRNFWNNQNARAWEEKERETSLTVLKSHISNYRMAEVPSKVQMICHGIDVQADHVYIATKGYAFRFESFLINAIRLETGNTGIAENWKIVEQYLRSQWFSKENVPYFSAKAGVDCRYQRDEESTVVYDFCLLFQPFTVIPIMGYGRDRMNTMPYRFRDVIGKALKRLDLNVDNSKDRLWQTLFDKEKTPGPGYMHLPNDMPESYMRQLASESQRIKRSRTGKEIVVWEKKEGFNENHLWDACGYADSIAEIAGVFFLQNVDYAEMISKNNQPETRRSKDEADYWGNMPEINL